MIGASRQTDATEALRAGHPSISERIGAIQALPKDENGQPQDPKESYWLRAMRVEALFGLKDPRYDEVRTSPFAAAPEPWMNGMTEGQSKEARVLLATPMPAFVDH